MCSGISTWHSFDATSGSLIRPVEIVYESVSGHQSSFRPITPEPEAVHKLADVIEVKSWHHLFALNRV
jgi:hypothetical protein